MQLDAIYHQCSDMGYRNDKYIDRWRTVFFVSKMEQKVSGHSEENDESKGILISRWKSKAINTEATEKLEENSGSEYGSNSVTPASRNRKSVVWAGDTEESYFKN